MCVLCIWPIYYGICNNKFTLSCQVCNKTTLKAICFRGYVVAMNMMKNYFTQAMRWWRSIYHHCITNRCRFTGYISTLSGCKNTTWSHIHVHVHVECTCRMCSKSKYTEEHRDQCSTHNHKKKPNTPKWPYDEAYLWSIEHNSHKKGYKYLLFLRQISIHSLEFSIISEQLTRDEIFSFCFQFAKPPSIR